MNGACASSTQWRVNLDSFFERWMMDLYVAATDGCITVSEMLRQLVQMHEVHTRCVYVKCPYKDCGSRLVERKGPTAILGYLHLTHAKPKYIPADA